MGILIPIFITSEEGFSNLPSAVSVLIVPLSQQKFTLKVTW